MHHLDQTKDRYVEFTVNNWPLLEINNLVFEFEPTVLRCHLALKLFYAPPFTNIVVLR